MINRIPKICLFFSLLLTQVAYASSEPPVPTLAPMLQKVLPAVVNITTERKAPPPTEASHTPTPQHPPYPFNPHAYGLASGVIVNAEKGYILTNEHVIRGAEKINVALKDGRRFKAKLIGRDQASDIALIRIKANDLAELSFGDSDHLSVGDFVVAIGNPYGLNQSVTSGVVSALGRTDLNIEGYEDFIQTDASINPGNSGGALVDLKGNLIGINTAILAPKGGNIGIGFAIPINMAENIMMQLIKFGEVRRGLLGVLVQTLTPELASSFNTSIKQKGAVIDAVLPDSLAMHTDLKIGDVIIKVNDHPVSSASSIRNFVGLIPLGDTMHITVLRDGKRKIISVKMLDPKKLTSVAGQIHNELAGALLGDFNQIIGTHGMQKGVAILAITPESPAATKGLHIHDVIVEADHQPITNLTELKSKANNKKELLLRVLRNNGAFYMALKQGD